MPDPTPELTGRAPLMIFTGGTLAELHSAAKAACPGGATVWSQDGSGAWFSYSTGAPAFVNISFASAFEDGFEGLTPVWVSACESDAMSDDSMMEN